MKKEAPWLFKQLSKDSLSNLVDHYFTVGKEENTRQVKWQH